MNDNYKSRKFCLYIFGGRKYIKMTHNNSFKIVIKNDQTPDLTYSIVINSWNIADSLGAECGLPISWESEDNSFNEKNVWQRCQVFWLHRPSLRGRTGKDFDRRLSVHSGKIDVRKKRIYQEQFTTHSEAPFAGIITIPYLHKN